MDNHNVRQELRLIPVALKDVRGTWRVYAGSLLFVSLSYSLSEVGFWRLMPLMIGMVVMYAYMRTMYSRRSKTMLFIQVLAAHMSMITMGMIVGLCVISAVVTDGRTKEDVIWGIGMEFAQYGAAWTLVGAILALIAHLIVVGKNMQ